MRFTSLAFPVLALIAVTGCSDPVPPTPDGAWFVSMTQPDPTMCLIEQHTDAVGVVDDASKTTTVTNAVNMAEVSCTVIGTTTFAVNATALDADKQLQIQIESITTGATMANPAGGQVGYSSAATGGTTYQGQCSFYFSAGTSESVGVDKSGVGKIWVSFTCPALTESSTTPPSSCPITQGYALFENCGSVSTSGQ